MAINFKSTGIIILYFIAFLGLLSIVGYNFWGWFGGSDKWKKNNLLDRQALVKKKFISNCIKKSKCNELEGIDFVGACAKQKDKCEQEWQNIQLVQRSSNERNMGGVCVCGKEPNWLWGCYGWFGSCANEPTCQSCMSDCLKEGNDYKDCENKCDQYCYQTGTYTETEGDISKCKNFFQWLFVGGCKL